MIIKRKSCVKSNRVYGEWWLMIVSTNLDLISYLKSIKFELEFLLLIQQLLQSICQYDIRIIESAVLFVELVVLVDLFIHCSSLPNSLNSKVLQISKILTLKRSARASLAVIFTVHFYVLIKSRIVWWNSAY